MILMLIYLVGAIAIYFLARSIGESEDLPHVDEVSVIAGLVWPVALLFYIACLIFVAVEH